MARLRVIEAAKQAVPVIELAERLCGSDGLRRTGNRWVARCPLPDHDERSASFTIYLETDSWYCFGCSRGGDVVHLAALAWGYGEGEMAMAAANLLHEFGHEIPSRPDSWPRRQPEKARVREGIQDTLAESYRRRWFRIIMPVLDGAGEDEAHEVWKSLWPLARERAEQRMTERGLA